MSPPRPINHVGVQSHAYPLIDTRSSSRPVECCDNPGVMTKAYILTLS